MFSRSYFDYIPYCYLFNIAGHLLKHHSKIPPPPTRFKNKQINLTRFYTNEKSKLAHTEPHNFTLCDFDIYDTYEGF